MINSLVANGRLQRREYIHDASNKLGKLMEVFHNRLFGEGQTLPEKYHCGQVDLLAGLGIEAPETLGGLYLRIENSIRQFSPYLGFDKGAMLIGDIEVMDCAQRVIPSRVWLQFVDLGHDLGAGPIYILLPDHHLQVVRILAEGEVDPLWVATRLCDQINGKQIQSGPEVVDRIADNKGNLLKSRPQSIADARAYLQEFARSIHVVLENDRVRLTIGKGRYPGIKISNMMVGPSDL